MSHVYMCSLPCSQVTIATFATFVESSPDNVLDARRAFVTLSLFNMLRVPLALLSTIISMAAQVCCHGNQHGVILAFSIVCIPWFDVGEQKTS